MALKFTVRPLTELPPDPKDQYGELEVAFRHLDPGKALFVETEAGNKRSSGQVKAALRKRFGKEAVLFRDDEGGVWAWSKQANRAPAQPIQVGGSDGGAPFNGTGHALQLRGPAIGAGAR